MNFIKRTIELTVYPLNETKHFQIDEIELIETIGFDLFKLYLKGGILYTVKGDIKKILEELNRK